MLLWNEWLQEAQRQKLTFITFTRMYDWKNGPKEVVRGGETVAHYPRPPLFRRLKSEYTPRLDLPVAIT